MHAYRVQLSGKKKTLSYRQNANIGVVANDVLEAAEWAKRDMESRGYDDVTVWNVVHLGQVDVLSDHPNPGIVR
jgi:hypothetical protein